MNTAVETYINGLFTNLPKTGELERARHELLQMSEDKYEELIAAGVSPHEATGRVITEFGDLDELADDLGIRAALDSAGDADTLPEVGREEAERSLRETRIQSLLIGSGVGMIMLAMAGFAWINPGEDAALPTALMFTVIAIAVVMFIISAFVTPTASKFSNREIALDQRTRAEYESRSERSTWKYAIGIAVGVGVIILGLVPTVILRQLDTFQSSGAAFLAMAAIGVTTLIVNGVNRSGLTALINAGPPDPRDEIEEQVDNRIGLIAGVYWTLAVTIYLAWSFIWSAWHISWILFPIAGVGFAVVATTTYAVTYWKKTGSSR
ncbi:permease prefix domain 1-containing protein [uncultured Agrococcus sp.]|uniref:permease prefix domain 1-containing protein n=1 Tax=uncultured Agrococcus sp. TaxID=382258 RepID=UPI0025F462B2|nr:permease prefix domain 1-containing protein [uncultured Agrococcus sp.]